MQTTTATAREPGKLQLTLNLDVGRETSTDDCAHAELIGIVRRALQGSPQLSTRYPGRLLGLVADPSETCSPDPYCSTFQIAEDIRPTRAAKLPRNGHRAQVLSSNDWRSNGIGRHDVLWLFPAEFGPDDLPADLPQERRERAIRIVIRDMADGPIVHAEPLIPVPTGHVGWMANGCYLTGDSTFSSEVERVLGEPFYGAVSLHDRCESTGNYATYD